MTISLQKSDDATGVVGTLGYFLAKADQFWKEKENFIVYGTTINYYADMILSVVVNRFSPILDS